MVRVYRRYLAVDPSLTERFTNLLLSSTHGEPRPLEAAKLLLSLARKAARGEYTSPEGKSPYQLLEDWIEVVEKYPEEVGLDVEETVTSNAAFAKEELELEAFTKNQESSKPDPASVTGQLIRIAGPPVAVDPDGKLLPTYNEEEDPLSPNRLNIEHIIQKDGLEVYKDQAGRLWTGLATYWIKRGEFDRAKRTFEEGMKMVLTIRDFTQIYDAYAEFDESLIGSIMEAIEGGDEEDEEELAELEKELDVRMKDMEALADRRPFLHNDVLLRRNPHDVQEWEKRVALWGDDDEQVGSLPFSLFQCEPCISYIHCFRRLKRTRQRLRPLTHEKQRQTCIGYMPTLQGSMRREASLVRRKLILTAHVKFLRRPRRLTLGQWKILLKYGASGRRWSSGMSMSKISS